MRKRPSRPSGDRHEHDLGLAHDMSVMLSRRRALWFLGAAGTASVAAACAPGTNTTATTSTPRAAAADTGTVVAGENARLTSRIALPQEVCEQVFDADSGYARSVTNLSEVTPATDNVFGDGWDAELATVTGSPESGMDISLTIGVAEKSANQAREGMGPGGGTPPGPPRSAPKTGPRPDFNHSEMTFPQVDPITRVPWKYGRQYGK